MPVDLFFRAGRQPNNLQMEAARELTPEDLHNFANAPALSGPPPLKTLRAIHHRQAQLLAEGKSIREVALIVGSTPQRVGDLQRCDPAFKDLIAYYENQINDAVVEDAQRVKTKLLDAAEMAVDELVVRLEDDGKRAALPSAELRQIAALGLDRTIAPPKVAPPPPDDLLNRILRMSEEERRAEAANVLRRIGQLVDQTKEPPIIDITPSPSPSPTGLQGEDGTAD